jgi:hypothetical protein
VRLNGIRAALSDEDLEKVVQSLPLEDIAGACGWLPVAG